MRNTPSEEVLWGYTTQLAAVLRAAHSMGLALRPATLSATKVGCCGVPLVPLWSLAPPAVQELGLGCGAHPLSYPTLSSALHSIRGLGHACRGEDGFQQL